LPAPRWFHRPGKSLERICASGYGKRTIESRPARASSCGCVVLVSICLLSFRSSLFLNLISRLIRLRPIFLQTGLPPIARWQRAWPNQPLLLLSFLASHILIGISHALAFIWLWWAECADFSTDLTNALLVDAADHNFGLARRLRVDAFR